MRVLAQRRPMMCLPLAVAEGYELSDVMAQFLRSLFSDPASGYGPSILSDMENGRRKESEHVIGGMVDREDRYGIAVPVLPAARCNLQAYEINRRRART